MKKIKRIPIIDETWRRIGPKPDFGGALPEINEDRPYANEPNDHCIFQGPDGGWHLWACVRRSPVGRALCHWESQNLTDAPWTFKAEDTIRADREAGESLVDWHGQEFLQSPYVIEHEGTWYMFYGGYASGVDSDGKPTTEYGPMENQICLMTSPDARNWTRHRDAEGRSRLFAGPGAARDEFVTRFGDTWFIYYCGHHDRDVENESIYVRTSDDLIHWSDWKKVHYDRIHGQKQCESPVVVFRDGYYYLFRTGAKEGGNLVIRSEDPFDFQIHEDASNLVCKLPVIAPEIFHDEAGNEYLSKINDPEMNYAINFCGLRWE